MVAFQDIGVFPNSNYLCCIPCHKYLHEVTKQVMPTFSWYRCDYPKSCSKEKQMSDNTPLDISQEKGYLLLFESLLKLIFGELTFAGIFHYIFPKPIVHHVNSMKHRTSILLMICKEPLIK